MSVRMIPEWHVLWSMGVEKQIGMIACSTMP